MRWFGIAYVLLNAIRVCGQSADPTSDEARPLVQVNIQASTIPLYDLITPAIGFEFNIHATRRLATGIGLTYSNRSIPYTFGYTIVKPVMKASSFCWSSAYEINRKKGFRYYLGGAFGGAWYRLGDNNEQVVTGTSRYGPVYEPKKIAENFLYIIEPRVGANWIFFQNTQIDVGLMASVAYRVVAGTTKFSNPSSFSGPVLQVGLHMVFKD